MKLLDVTMDNCDASFNICHLTCLAQTEKIDEYAYDTGYLFNSETLKDIGAKDPLITIFDSSKTGKEVVEKQRISKCQIRSVSAIFDKGDQLVSVRTSIFHDLSTLNVFHNNCENCKKFLEDLRLIVFFLDEICSMEIFFDKDTSHILPGSLKEYLALRLSINNSKSKGRKTQVYFDNKLLSECKRVLIGAAY
jgi:hypothetical protein